MPVLNRKRIRDIRIEIRSQYADGGTSIPTAARNAGLCRRHRLNDCSLKHGTHPASVRHHHPQPREPLQPPE